MIIIYLLCTHPITFTHTYYTLAGVDPLPIINWPYYRFCYANQLTAQHATVFTYKELKQTTSIPQGVNELHVVSDKMPLHNQILANLVYTLKRE